MYSDAERWVKMLFVYLYYFGARISEAITVTHDDFVELDGMLSVTSLTLKNTSQASRTLWVSLEAPFINELVYYIKDTNGRLFPYSRQWAWKQLQQVYRWITPHGFRHNILDDFAQDGESPFALKSWAGWSDIRPADTYVQAVDTKRMARRKNKDDT